MNAELEVTQVAPDRVLSNLVRPAHLDRTHRGSAPSISVPIYINEGAFSRVSILETIMYGFKN
jgi:predicted methyltransferase MtxX (methanogen marker protein 4)